MSNFLLLFLTGHFLEVNINLENVRMNPGEGYFDAIFTGWNNKFRHSVSLTPKGVLLLTGKGYWFNLDLPFTLSDIRGVELRYRKFSLRDPEQVYIGQTILSTGTVHQSFCGETRPTKLPNNVWVRLPKDCWVSGISI